MLKRGRARASRNLRERRSAGRGRGVVTPRHGAAAPSIADAGGCQEMRSSNAKPGSGWATSSPSGIGSGSSPQAAGPRAGAIGNGAVGSPTLARIRCTGAASVTNAIMRICAPQPGHASSATRFCPSVVRRAGECPVPVSLRPVRSGGEAAGQDALQALAGTPVSDSGRPLPVTRLLARTVCSIRQTGHRIPDHPDARLLKARGGVAHQYPADGREPHSDAVTLAGIAQIGDDAAVIVNMTVRKVRSDSSIFNQCTAIPRRREAREAAKRAREMLRALVACCHGDIDDLGIRVVEQTAREIEASLL